VRLLLARAALITAAAYPLFSSAQQTSRDAVQALLSRLSCIAHPYSWSLTIEANNWPTRLPAGRSDPLLWTGSAEIRLRQAELGEYQGVDEALESAERAVRSAPNAAESHLVLARAATLAGATYSALHALERAVALGADEQGLKVAQAKFAISTGRLQVAERLLEQAAIAPAAGYPRSSVQMMLGDVRMDLGKLNEAAQAYRDAADTACSHVAYMKYATSLWYIKQDTEGAKRVLQTLLQDFPLDRNPKRLLDGIEYFVWAQGLLEGKSTAAQGARLAQTSFAFAEDVFIEAAQYPGGLVVMRALAESRVLKNLDARDGSGNTALIAAAKANNADAGDYLLKLGANPDARNGNGERAIGHYARHGNVRGIAALLQRGVEVDFVDRKGMHPLAAAVISGRAEAVELLLKAKPSYQNLDLREVVNKAVLRGDVRVLRLLLKGGTPINGGEDVPPPLMLAVMMRDLEVVRCLLEYGADPLREFNGQSIQDLARETLDPALIQELSRSKL
jgi:tetratricopeptide (TPR) repeat protein